MWFLLMYFSERVMNAVVLSPAGITRGILKIPDVQATHQNNFISTSRGGTQSSSLKKKEKKKRKAF